MLCRPCTTPHYSAVQYLLPYIVICLTCAVIVCRGIEAKWLFQPYCLVAQIPSWQILSAIGIHHNSAGVESSLDTGFQDRQAFASISCRCSHINSCPKYWVRPWYRTSSENWSGRIPQKKKIYQVYANQPGGNVCCSFLQFNRVPPGNMMSYTSSIYLVPGTNIILYRWNVSA